MSEDERKTKPWRYCTTGAYLVLAGPGTGKTYTVIHRIENLVKYEHVEPSKIMCLTFSNAAVKEMLDRLKTDVDIEGANVFNLTWRTNGNPNVGIEFIVPKGKGH